MGYPGSMGSAQWTDLVMTDAVASPPDVASHYTEKLLLLPHSYYLNDYRQSAALEKEGTTRYG